jgi:hypothetical protein
MLLAAAVALRESLAGGAVIGVVAIFMVLSLFSLTTVVSDDAVRVWFGIGLISRRIALDRITSARPVGNNWIFGWGVRWIPGGWLWNVSGLDAVELSLVSGRRFRIGTDEPEELAAAIQKALRTVQGLSV